MRPSELLLSLAIGMIFHKRRQSQPNPKLAPYETDEMVIGDTLTLSILGV